MRVITNCNKLTIGVAKTRRWVSVLVQKTYDYFKYDFIRNLLLQKG